jgi:death-on-curing protein
MDDPEWVLIEEAIALHADQLALHGGADGIRDLNLLASAISRPRHLFAYTDPTPTVPELAAAYAVAIAKNHAFIDGNKRAALAVSLTFLDRNGFVITAKLNHRFEKFLALAAGDLSENEFTDWLRRNVKRVGE